MLEAQQPTEQKKEFNIPVHIENHLTTTDHDQLNRLLLTKRQSISNRVSADLENFIQRNYSEVNRQLLGGFEGVITLQKKLGATRTDGNFGIETFQLLVKYQRENGLHVDGLAGKSTQSSLGIIKKKPLIHKASLQAQENKGELLLSNTHYNIICKNYSIIIQSLQEQISMINKQRTDNTGVVGGIGDLIGSKTGMWVTGKETYGLSVQAIKRQAQLQYDRFLTELKNKPVPADAKERSRIKAIQQSFSALIGTQLKDVSWGTAILNTTVGESKGQAGPVGDAVEYGVRGIAGIAKGSSDMIVGAVEMTGKLIGILTAASIHSEVRAQFIRDCANILSEITLENAQKLLSHVSQHIQSIGKLPSDDQADAIGKLTGEILAMFGALGAEKVARAGKAIAQSGARFAQSGAQSIGSGMRIRGAAQIISGSTGVVVGKTAQVTAISVGTLGGRPSGNIILQGDKQAAKTVAQTRTNKTPPEIAILPEISKVSLGRSISENSNLNPPRIRTVNIIDNIPPKDIRTLSTKPKDSTYTQTPLSLHDKDKITNIPPLQDISILRGKYLSLLEHELVTSINSTIFVADDMVRDTALKQLLIAKVQKITQEGKYETIIFNQSEMSDFVKKFFPNASFSNYEIEIYGHLAFIKDSHGRYHLNDETPTSLFGRLKYNPLMGGIGEDFLAMMAQSKISFSGEVTMRILESSQRYDSRYGNGLSSMTRYMSALINKGSVHELFQGGKIPENIEQNLFLYSPQSEYIKIVRDLIISATRSHSYKELGGYKSYQSGISPRDKSCKDAESYFSSLLSASAHAAQKKYRIIGDFIEKNVDGAQRSRTALSTKEVVVAGVHYPRGYLFRLNTDGEEILGVEPLRLTIFSGSNILQDGEKAFGHQYIETKRIIDDDIKLVSGEFDNDMIGLFLKRLT